jgi:hypothetical protein
MSQLRIAEMNRTQNLASIRALKAPPSELSAEMLICSEENFVATDNLRSALADLEAAYTLLQQLLDFAKSEAPTTSKDI